MRDLTTFLGLIVLYVVAVACGSGCSLETISITTADSHSETTRIHWLTDGRNYAVLPGPKDGSGKVFEAKAGDVRQGQSEAGIAVAQELGGVAKIFLLVEGAVEVFRSLVGMSAVTTSPGGGVRAVGPAAQTLVEPK